MSKQWLTIGLVSLGLAGLAASPARAEDKEKKGEEKEVKVAIADVPAAVLKTLKREAGDAKLTTVDKEERDGKMVYEADAVIDGTNYEIVVDKDGKLLSKTVDAEVAEKAAEDKAGEKKDGDKKEAKSEKADGEKKGTKEKKGKKAEKEEDDDEKPAAKDKGGKDKGEKSDKAEKGKTEKDKDEVK